MVGANEDIQHPIVAFLSFVVEVDDFVLPDGFIEPSKISLEEVKTLYCGIFREFVPQLLAIFVKE